MTDSSSERIAASLRTWIARAAPGVRLPATRVLIEQHRASPVTVQRALAELIRQGLVESRPGVGTFVREGRIARPHDYTWQTGALGAARPRPRMAAALRAAPAETIALHAGYPDRELLPERLVRAALGRASRGDAALSRPPVAGLEGLRAWFAAELGAQTAVGGTPPGPGDAIILPGSQSGLSACFRGLVGPGEPLLVESPTYFGAILAAEQSGVDLVPVPSGAQGPDPDDLAAVFARTGARAFYAQPNFANPTGAQWSASRAEAILGVVREHRAFLIEDDWAHDFGITAGSAPVAAHDDAGHVVYLRSLTKSVSPSLRVAGLIARGPAHERILAEMQAQVMYVSGVLQTAALDVVTQPGWRTHLRGLSRQLAARRDLLVDALAEHAPIVHLERVPRGGLNLWVRLPDEADLDAVVRSCEARGVLVASGDGWFPAEPSGRFLRLNYSGPDPGRFPEAARILGEVIGA